MIATAAATDGGAGEMRTVRWAHYRLVNCWRPAWPWRQYPVRCLVRRQRTPPPQGVDRPGGFDAASRRQHQVRLAPPSWRWLSWLVLKIFGNHFEAGSLRAPSKAR
jgi:hypothetical protein